MIDSTHRREPFLVALRKESVDRNSTYDTRLPRAQVALRKESVDRNNPLKTFIILPEVALRKESVDRNFHEGQQRDILGTSLSARRAWIEICSDIPL